MAAVNVASIRKALTPAVLGVIAVVTEWIATDVWSAEEWRYAVATLVTSLAVYFIPNDPS